MSATLWSVDLASIDPCPEHGLRAMRVTPDPERGYVLAACNECAVECYRGARRRVGAFYGLRARGRRAVRPPGGAGVSAAELLVGGDAVESRRHHVPLRSGDGPIWRVLGLLEDCHAMFAADPDWMEMPAEDVDAFTAAMTRGNAARSWALRPDGTRETFPVPEGPFRVSRVVNPVTGKIVALRPGEAWRLGEGDAPA